MEAFHIICMTINDYIEYFIAIILNLNIFNVQYENNTTSVPGCDMTTCLQNVSQLSPKPLS